MRLLTSLAALLGCSLFACGELPGEVVGTYKISMKLEENTCGEGAVNLLDGHRYAAELRSDAKHGYWRVPGQPPLEGKFNPPSFRFENAGIVANEGADAGPRGCTLRQLDVLTGALNQLPDAGDQASAEGDAGEPGTADDLDDAGSEQMEAGAGEGARPAGALHGQHTFTVSAVAGTDCTVALEPRGRFEKLPCRVRYSVLGVDTKPF